ncbi:MAG: type II secretion system F family protein [Bdellovibrionaceae bacterium]|nr:type II secretion system F family protein [Pseudobdellovibrionaceae bacterium]MDW8189552.1 type II secretion system F family protein [Pseudobdellovibrionaceae bacterium]
MFLVIHTLIRRDRSQEILSWASGNEPVKSASPLINFARPLVHQIFLKYVKYFKNPEKVEKLEKLILTSGLSRELNVDEFIGLQLFWGIGFPLFIALLNFAYDLGLSYGLVALGAVVGWKFPELYANQMKTKRNLSIQAELPFFADILALSTEAGLDFVGAIQKLADKARNSVLGAEFEIVLKDIKLGATRAEALRGLSRRCDLMEVTSFVAVLIDADQTGASIAKVLKDQSNQLRLERFVRAEKAGAKASQLIFLPIVLLIVPAIFLVVFGPLAISFFSGGR